MIKICWPTTAKNASYVRSNQARLSLTQFNLEQVSKKEAPLFVFFCQFEIVMQSRAVRDVIKIAGTLKTNSRVITTD